MRLKALAAGAAVATMALAGISTAYAEPYRGPISWLQNIDNPCTAAVEAISLDGLVNFAVIQGVEADGSTRTIVHSTVAAKGVDAVSGAKYHLQARDQIKYTGAALDFNPRNASQGPIVDMYAFRLKSSDAPDFSVKGTFRMQDGGVTFEKWDMSCK